MTSYEYVVLITDKNLNVVADPLVNWSSIDVTLRFSEPGSGLFVAPGYAWLRDATREPGNRVLVTRNRAALLSGPITNRNYERADDGEHAGDGTLTVNFDDDLRWIAGRLAYQDPTLAPAAQVTDNWTYTGNAEAALRTLVNLNAGPGALIARRVPKLVLGSLAGVGSSITAKATIMEPLGDVLRRIAADGGELGFRTRQVGSNIHFEVYDPPDVSSTVRFGFNLGNAKYISYQVAAPTATTAIVGGQGEGADRFVLERNNAVDEAAWGRTEMFVARPGSTATAELEADGDDALRETGETARLVANVADADGQRYGEDYSLGSRVSIEAETGAAVTDIVRTVHFQAWATAGEYVSATVGSQAATADPQTIQLLRNIDRRVGRLERTAASA